MNIKIKQHIEDLHRINSQRKNWLILSAFVAFAILGIIVGWNTVQQSRITWVLVSLGLLVSMSWWYWTMKIIRHLISYKITESEILEEIVQEIRFIKNEVVKDITDLVDKDK